MLRLPASCIRLQNVLDTDRATLPGRVSNTPKYVSHLNNILFAERSRLHWGQLEDSLGTTRGHIGDS